MTDVKRITSHGSSVRADGGIARRAFLERLAALMVAVPLAGWRGETHARGLSERLPGEPEIGRLLQDSDQLLAVVAAVVLPRELGSADTVRAFQEFRRWRDGYRPNAEMNHGYGTARITTTPADPRPRWRGQLLALDAEARRKHGEPLGELDPAAQESLVRAALDEDKGDAFPSPAAARHVAVALLAHFYDSPAANDLCYQAEIGRQQCRPLAAQTQPPAALRRRGA